MTNREIRPFIFSYTAAPPYVAGSIIPTVPLFEPTQRTRYLGLDDRVSTPPHEIPEVYEGMATSLPDDPVPEVSENRGFTRQQWIRGAYYVGHVGMAFVVLKVAHKEGVFRAGFKFAEMSSRHQSMQAYTAFTAFIWLPASLGNLIKTFYPAELTPRIRYTDIRDFFSECVVYTTLGYVGIRWFKHSEAVREWLHPNPAFWTDRCVPLLLLGLSKEVIVSRTTIFAERPYDGMLEPLNRFTRELSALVWRFVEDL